MAGIQIKLRRVDASRLGRELKRKVDQYPRGIAAGVNRTSERALTLAVREIQSNTGASSQKTIRRNIGLKRATAQTLEAEVIARSARYERIPLYELKPRPKNVTARRPQVGVTYGPRSKTIPGSFIARMRKTTGHIGVFRRIGDRINPTKNRFSPLAGHPGVFENLPFRRRTSERIAELFGPSVALVFSRRRVQQTIRAFIRQRLPEEVRRALRFARV